ncbi:CorA family divalent cation transporter [Kaistia sp. 32K]|uniref:CorA family divalent cation transporter n=1 Tax=Kaistia sp. 32K TaxID=2795690 RepID=UPI0019154215|nr:CorA family divalent cation transporter [Kaistia sp. 32K]
MPAEASALSRPVSGVIWAYRFDAGGGARAIALDETIAPSDPAEGFVWVHIDFVDRLARDWIAGVGWLSGDARRLLLSVDDHPTLDFDKHAVWGRFSDTLQEHPGEDSDRTVPMRFAFGPGYLVSGRRHPVRAAALARSKIQSGQPVSGPVALFELMIEQVLRAMAETLRALRMEADSIEDRVLDERLHDESRRLGPLRRTAVKLHRQLSGFRSILREFPEDDDDEDEQSHQAASAAAERLLRRIETLDQEVQEVQDRARFLQDEIAAKLANISNRHLYVLSIMTALLMPPTLVTGFFGMNTGGLPFLDGSTGWIGASVIGVVASGFTLLLLRRLGFFD